MSGRGRPLRFLALLVMGWSGTRAALLWPGTPSATPPSLPAATRIVVRPGRGLPIGPPPVTRTADAPLNGHGCCALVRKAPGPVSPPTRWADASPVVAVAETAEPVRGAPEAIRASFPREPSPGTASAQDTPVLAAPLPPPGGRPWSASLWLAARGSRGLGPGGGGQLGGAQAGARLAWTLDARRRVALFGRVTTPLSGSGREVSGGIEWQPTRLPVRMVVEQRVTLDGGKGGPGAGLIAGVDAMPIAAGFSLEAYGQAGVIRRTRTEPYADGAARVTRAVGPLALRLGVGSWGGAQRDAQRLDVGPTLTLRLPVADRSLRVLLDWRQRVAGSARPGSGAALTLASDL
jgi:hypothetical protein